jgi:MFS family permease
VDCWFDQLDYFPDCWSDVSSLTCWNIAFAKPNSHTSSGAFIVDPLNHYLGRRGEIFVTAVCLTVTPIGSGLAQTWQGLFAARFVMGIGIGAKNATVPIYSSEMAPHRVRGALVMFWQLWVVAGIFLGFCANVIVKDTGKSCYDALA